jgi:hypothetical protein
VPRRLVLLGASNAVRGFHIVVRAARQAWGDPVEVLGALGLGRSYGMRSAVLARSLPGIVECGLWAELERRPPAPTAALVTDVGNDIVYGASTDAILAWVESCVERLQAAGAEVAITGLPLERLARLSPAGYAALKAVLFPFHPWLPLPEALRRARVVAEGVRRLAERRGACFVPLRPEWYGLDPIHMSPRRWEQGWGAIMAAACGEAPAAAAVAGAGPSALRLFALRPERQWVFGRKQTRAQPALALPGGGSVSLY